jgi:ATP-dependent DNA ligase
MIVELGKLINLQDMGKAKKEITERFNEAKRMNCEGLVAKELGKNSIYWFGKRRWYKLKTLSNKITKRKTFS